MLATLACVIAGMGLVGMAIHIVSRRMHEIGVRKTLGASIAQVLRMLLFDFSRPIVIANLIVWPIAFLAASAYLAVFVQRAPLTPWPFLMSLAVTVLIASAAVIAQVGKAARLKPAQVLPMNSGQLNRGLLVNWPTGLLARARYARAILRRKLSSCQSASRPVGQ